MILQPGQGSNVVEGVTLNPPKGGRWSPDDRGYATGNDDFQHDAVEFCSDVNEVGIVAKGDSLFEMT
jgi:hypothetical protein